MNSTNNLVSIIIPVYNVEKYLNRCIDSVIKQSYKNIEILLIDDGSTDESGIILDKYKKNDARIKVFHKKNEGLSSTRNYGLKKCSGEYVCFIDSDDFISKYMIETLLKNLLKTKSDISICGIKYFYDGDKIDDKCSNECIEYNREEALLKMIDYNSSVAPNAVNKLDNRNLFSIDCLYPVGKLYEDMGVTAKLFSKCNKIVYTPDCYYYYVQRSDSITNESFREKDLDHIYMSKLLYNFIYENIKPLKNEYYVYHILNEISCCNKIFASNEKKHKDIITQTKNDIKHNFKLILKSNVYNFKKKMQIICMGYFTNIYKNIYLINYNIKKEERK